MLSRMARILAWVGWSAKSAVSAGIAGECQKLMHSLILGQSGDLCRGHLLVPQTVCRWEVHDIHVILAG